MADGEELQQGVAAFYASSVSLAASGADVKIVFGDNIPIVEGDGGLKELKRQVATAKLSFHSAKDLHALTSTMLVEPKRLFGAINTPLLQKPRGVRVE